MTRVIAGVAGGRRLEVPRSATRPTSDRVREALFSRLEHERDLRGAVVLDLFAGSGALGLEAASRGAGRVLLVDSAAPAAASCRRNAEALGLPGVTVHAVAAATALAAGPAAAGLAGEDAVDVALLDPPYDLAEDALTAVLVALAARRWLAGDAHVVVERARRAPEPSWPKGLVRTDERRYGDTVLWWAEPAGADGPAAGGGP